MSNIYFKNNLKYLREKRGIEQLELARLLGRKSASSISEWEKGTYTPKVGVFNCIHDLYKNNKRGFKLSFIERVISPLFLF